MRRRTIHTLGAAIGALALVAAFGAPAAAQSITPDAEGFLTATPADLAKVEGRSINIVGDPSKPGIYVVRITFPPGQGSHPHFHDQARYITVIKGTWWVSTGQKSDVYDPDHMERVPVGSFIYEPPNGHHYDMAKDEAVTVQIIGIGPVKTTQIPQADAPAR